MIDQKAHDMAFYKARRQAFLDLLMIDFEGTKKKMLSSGAAKAYPGNYWFQGNVVFW